MLALLFAAVLAQAPAATPCPNRPISNPPEITVQVSDGWGNAIGGAQVMLKPSIGNVARYAAADGEGCTTFTAGPGTYTVAARAQGFRTGSEQTTAISGKEASVTLHLAIDHCDQCVALPKAIYLTVCAIDEKRLPALPASFTLQERGNHSGIVHAGDHLDDWGCETFAVPHGKYILSLNAKGFRNVRKKLTAASPWQTEWVQLQH